MKKKTGILIIIIVLCGLLLGNETEDWRYKKICTQGSNGYQMYRSEYGVHSRKDFWNYFYNLIRNFKQNKKFGNILACSKFWNELKQDQLFDTYEDARADKAEIDDIFASAKNEYRKDFKDRMFALEPIDLEGEKDPEKVKGYTADKKFAHIVQIYANNYKIINDNPLPKPDEIDDIQARWQEMSANNLVKETIKKTIDDYFTRLNEFYRIQVRENDSYDNKLKTCASKKAKLEEIIRIAASIDKFNIKRQLYQIIGMIRSVDYKVEFWQKHKEVEEIISTFEKKSNPTIDDLYAVRQKVIDAASGGKEWEISLYEKIRFFWELLPQKQLTLEWFEKNLEPNMNDNSKRTEILKSVYKERLFGVVVKKMNEGGNSVEDLIEIQILTEKYKKLFKEETGKENCLALIKRYYDAKESLDYPKMIMLYDEVPNTISACGKVVIQAWHLKRSKKAVNAEYKKHYLELMHKALDGVGIKDEKIFNAFWLIHAKKHWTPPKDYMKRFKYLYTYFRSPNSIDREKAARDLHKNYPNLAYSYRIPDPEKDIIYIGDEGESTVGATNRQPKSPSTVENDSKMSILDFLEIMHTFVKKSRLDDQELFTVCKKLLFSDLKGPDFDRVIENYKQHIPQNYDGLMNRFFYLIYAREAGWQKNSIKIINTAGWPSTIKTKMKEILEEIIEIFD